MVALLVDDETTLRHVVEWMLKAEGYEVIAACDGIEGLEISRSFSGDIALVVSDILMPRMDGREMLKHITAERPTIKVLVMTGFAVGNEDFPNLLRKPFQFPEFRAKLREVMAQTERDGAPQRSGSV